MRPSAQNHSQNPSTVCKSFLEFQFFAGFLQQTCLKRRSGTFVQRRGPQNSATVQEGATFPAFCLHSRVKTHCILVLFDQFQRITTTTKHTLCSANGPKCFLLHSTNTLNWPLKICAGMNTKNGVPRRNDTGLEGQPPCAMFRPDG